ITIANIRAAGLPIVEVRARMGLTIALLAWDPAFEIIHTNLAITHIPRTDFDDTIRQLQSLYQFLCIVQQRLKPVHRLLMIRFTDDILLYLIELVNAENPTCILAIGSSLLAETRTIRDKF